MRTNKQMLIGTCALAVLALSGCKREATGQVAAVVNGDEITLAELNQEIGQGELPANVDKKAVQRAALQKIIDRRLVAQVARDEGIDKQPEFLAKRRQGEELLLIQMFGQKLNRTARVPDAGAINKYMADHPNMFAQRTLLKVDRIQFPMPKDSSAIMAIKDDHSLDAVAARLNSMGIKFQRAQGGLDSAQIPAPVLARIKALPPGEPFAMPSGKDIVVAVVTGSEVQPFVGADANPVALNQLRLEDLQKTMADRLKTARASAKIEYQAGFAPTPAPSAAAKKGS